MWCPQKIEVYQNKWRLDERPYTWSWQYGDERFERPHMEAYKISLHHSFREDGKPKKKQYSVATISYYGFLDYGLYEYVGNKLENIAAETGIEFGALYELVEEKLAPLMDRIRAEFKQSEEYQTQRKHEEILEAYRKVKKAFGEKYRVDDTEYDRCFDIYGELKNKEYLEQLIHNWRRSSYQEYNSSTYSSGEGSSRSYHIPSDGNYTDTEREMLRQFYRLLVKRFHPDVNYDQDTTEYMKLLNKLAEEWNPK